MKCESERGYNYYMRKDLEVFHDGDILIIRSNVSSRIVYIDTSSLPDLRSRNIFYSIFLITYWYSVILWCHQCMPAFNRILQRCCFLSDTKLADVLLLTRFKEGKNTFLLSQFLIKCHAKKETLFKTHHFLKYSEVFHDDEDKFHTVLHRFVA